MLESFYPPFPGFRREGLELLRQLKLHNERSWFQERKELFETELFWPARCLVAELDRLFARGHLPLRGDPKRALFRIYRDIRFSRDKSPYKTHVGIILSRSGHRMDPGVVYIHIEPEASFLGAGFWRPERRLLLAFRQAMVDDPETFLHMQHLLKEAELELTAREMLKRLPRGFHVEPNTPIAPYLRFQSFVTQRPLHTETLLSRDLLQHILQFSRDVLPLLTWGWEALNTFPSQ